MERLKRFIPLHLTILLFSLTSVFSKAASIRYNTGGLRHIRAGLAESDPKV